MTWLAGLLEALARALAAIAPWLLGREAGKASARLDAAEAILDARSKADAIDDRVARANRASVDDGLRSFSRD